MTSLRGLLCFLALTLGMPALASVTDSDSTLVNIQQHNLLREIERGDLIENPFPSDLGPKQCYVVFYLGGSFKSVLVMGQPGDDGKAYAQVLDNWQSAHGGDGKAVYSQEDDYAAASLQWPKSNSFLSTTGRQELDAPSILSAIRQAGFQPLGVAVAGKYAKVDGAGNPIISVQSLIFDLRSDFDGGPITTSVALSPLSRDLFFAWLIGLPIIVFSLFGVACLVAKIESIPIMRRRVLFRQIGLFGTFAAIGVHFVVFQGFLLSGSLKGFCDLWFGTSRTTSIMPFVMVGPILLLPLIVITRPAEKRLFGPLANGAPPPAQAGAVPPTLTTYPPISTSSRASDAKSVLLSKSFIVRQIGLLFLIASLVLNYFGKQFQSASILTLIVAITFWAVGIFLKPKTPGTAFDPGVPSPELTARAEPIASRMGVKPPSVSVREGAMINGSASKKGVFVTKRAVDELNWEEMDYLLAHEIAHHKIGLRKPIFAPLGVLMLSFVGFQIYIFGTPPPHPEWIVPAFFTFFMVSVAGCIYWSVKRSQANEIAADALAIQVTGNRQAALTCLKKIQASSALPYAHELGSATHPSILKRFEKIEKGP